MDCLVIGTNIKVRLPNLITTLKSIDSCTKELVNKIVSIDVFKKEQTVFEISNCQELEEYCRENKWRVLMHEKLGMCENILWGLKYIKSKYVLYSEDDVIITSIPTITDIRDNSNLLGRELGFINMTMGGWNKDKKLEIATKINDKTNVFSVNNGIFVHQDEELRNGFFISFPVAIYNSELFQKLLKSTKESQLNIQIEQAMTNEWFRLEYDKKYYKLVYLKNIYEKTQGLLKFKPKTILNVLEGNTHVEHNRSQRQGVLWDYWFHK